MTKDQRITNLENKLTQCAVVFGVIDPKNPIIREINQLSCLPSTIKEPITCMPNKKK